MTSLQRPASSSLSRLRVYEMQLALAKTVLEASEIYLVAQIVEQPWGDAGRLEIQWKVSVH